MRWNADMAAGKGGVAGAALALVLWAGTACTQQQAGDVLFKAAEGTARAACENAGNCRNTCPDGSVMRGPFYRCP